MRCQLLEIQISLWFIKFTIYSNILCHARLGKLFSSLETIILLATLLDTSLDLLLKQKYHLSEIKFDIKFNITFKFRTIVIKNKWTCVKPDYIGHIRLLMAALICLFYLFMSERESIYSGIGWRNKILVDVNQYLISLTYHTLSEAGRHAR